MVSADWLSPLTGWRSGGGGRLKSRTATSNACRRSQMRIQARTPTILRNRPTFQFD